MLRMPSPKRSSSARLSAPDSAPAPDWMTRRLDRSALCEARVFDHGLQHRRQQHRRVDAFALDRVDHRTGVEVFVQPDAGTQVQRQQGVDAAGAQADRQHAQRAVVHAEALFDGAFLEAEARAQRALGPAGRARGVQHHGAAGAALGHRTGRAGLQRLPAQCVGRRVGFGIGKPDPAPCRIAQRLGALGEARTQQHEARVRGSDAVAQVVVGQAVVQRCRDRADAGEREVGHQHVGVVGRQHRHLLARRQAQRGQRAHRAFGAGQQFGVAERAVAEADRDALRVAPRVQPQRVEQGHAHVRRCVMSSRFQFNGTPRRRAPRGR